jgi:AraC-like DNA-binding protein
MEVVLSRESRLELRPFVRAYAQRIVDSIGPGFVNHVPAQLEQVLNFELGALPGIRHRQQTVSDVVWIGGAQTAFAGTMELHPGVHSFAIFFEPAGWSTLFGIPVWEITDRIADATAFRGGAETRSLWNQLGEACSFEARIRISDAFLLDRISRLNDKKSVDAMSFAANLIRRQHGAVPLSVLAGQNSLGMRQFERNFKREIGVSPKSFARVARFQGAVDAKLARPARSWLDIAHTFGYFDQMHMIHDFEKFGRTIPSRLIAQMGEVRPLALTATSH